MSASAELEHTYRRLMRWYPASFRDEYGQELVDLLMTAAPDGQRRPELREGLNLMANGLWARLRPTVPSSARTVLAAVRLMYIGAAVELATVITLLATEGAVRSSVFRVNPGFTSANWNLVAGINLIPRIVLGFAMVAGWLVLAWAVGRGYDWARRFFGAVFCLLSLSLIAAFVLGAVSYAVLDVTALVVLWLFELTVMLLLFNKRSAQYFHSRRKSAPQDSSRLSTPRAA
jgi:hypothetical protein